MPFGEKTLQRPAGKLELLQIVSRQEPLFINRHYVAKHLLEALLTVNLRCAPDQPGWVRQMRYASRVHYCARIRQVFHQFAGASGMIQVYMGQKNIIDVGCVHVFLAQGVEKQRYTCVRARIDKRGTPVFDNQVTGVENRTNVVRVDGGDGVASKRYG